MQTHKRQRRTATAVLAGDFDERPPRDVLTSVLNSNPYRAVEKLEEQKERKKRRRVTEQGRQPQHQQKSGAKTTPPAPTTTVATMATTATTMTTTTVRNTNSTSKDKDHYSLPARHPPSHSYPPSQPPVYQPGRPQINIIMPRSMSVTPPPMLPPAALIYDTSPSSTKTKTTRGLSVSSDTSRSSSLKRLRTPADGELLDDEAYLAAAAAEGSLTPPPAQLERHPRKKRPAVRKGWKGWVEGSPPPSDKLINLDSAPVLQERRTRNGKPFGAIGENDWV
jgi:hypothetical protein